MFGLPLEMLLPPEIRAARKAAVRARYERLIYCAPSVPWAETLSAPRGDFVLDAKSWKPFQLFDAKTDSPCGSWRYDTLVLKRAEPLDVKTHRGRCKVVFDGDVVIPRVCELTPQGYSERMWMSYTPQEVFTQRPGLRKAKGHTVVAGLGMGWLLSRVMEKKSVKEVTLVEKSAELVAWLLPMLRERLPDKPLNVFVGDAHEVVPKLSADVALWDIWELFGGAYNAARDRTHARCPGIGETWFWGASGWKD